MSENITHTAILDDCFRLAGASGRVGRDFKAAMSEMHRFARLGGITRSGDLFTVPLLEALRGRWPQGPDEQDRAKLAFVLGWLTHRAADRQMKPYFRQVEPHPRPKPPECSVYNDAFVFKEVYASGANEPYDPAIFEDRLESAPAAAAVDVPAVEELIQVLLQRALIELHTLLPDRDNIETWMEKLFGRQQQFYVDRHRYAAAIATPDPVKLRHYIIEPNFYDRDEPIIRCARAIQHGQTPPYQEVDQAIDAPAASHYARALRTGCGYLIAASRFFEGGGTVEQLRDTLDIDRLGRDGQSV